MCVQSLSRVLLFVTPWPATHQVSLSLIIFWILPKFMSTELVMLYNHLIFCCPFSFCLQSFPASGSFPMSQLFGGQTTGASVSATLLPVNIQSWFPLGLVGLISLQSKGLSRVFSSTTIQSINSLALGLLCGPVLISIHACMRACVLSCVWLFATSWTAVHQAPLFMEFSKQEYWSGFPFPTPRDWLLFCDWGFIHLPCDALSQHITVLLVFLWPWTWSISSQLLQRHTAASHCMQVS